MKTSLASASQQKENPCNEGPSYLLIPYPRDRLCRKLCQVECSHQFWAKNMPAPELQKQWLGPYRCTAVSPKHHSTIMSLI